MEILVNHFSIILQQFSFLKCFCFIYFTLQTKYCVCRGRVVKFHLHRNNMRYILWEQASDATTWEWMWMIKFQPFIFPKQFLKWIYHCGFLDKKLEFWCFVNKLLLCFLFWLKGRVMEEIYYFSYPVLTYAVLAHSKSQTIHMITPSKKMTKCCYS